MPFAPQLQELDPDSYEGKWLLQEWAYCSTGRSHLNLGPNSVVTPSQMIPTKPTIQLQVQQSSYKMYHHKHGDLMHIFYLMLLQVRSSTQVLQAKCKVLARQCSLWRLQERICFLDFSQLLGSPTFSSLQPRLHLQSTSFQSPFPFCISLTLTSLAPSHKDACDYIGPTQIIQNNRSISKSIT